MAHTPTLAGVFGTLLTFLDWFYSCYLQKFDGDINFRFFYSICQFLVPIVFHFPRSSVPAQNLSPYVIALHWNSVFNCLRSRNVRNVFILQSQLFLLNASSSLLWLGPFISCNFLFHYVSYFPPQLIGCFCRRSVSLKNKLFFTTVIYSFDLACIIYVVVFHTHARINTYGKFSPTF